MKISLSVTHNCNLRCNYCYTGEKIHKNMNLKTASEIVDFAFEITPCENQIDFSFFGGEPLLCFYLIKDVIAYVKTKEFSNPISYNITTNGTIINDEIIDFVNQNNIKLSISIDGPEHIHDKNRVDINNNGTLKTVLQNIKKISNKVNFFQVNAVYGPDTVGELGETFSFLIENEIKNIHLNPNITQNWDESMFSKITDAYENIAEKYMSHYKSNQEVALNLIDSKLILFLKGGYDKEDKCGMGETEFGFAPSGNVYPCERLIGDDTNDEMCMGNIHTGINPLKRCSIGKKRGNSNAECVTCSVQKYCMNWCGCTNYNMTGYSDKVSSMLCYSERAAITAAKKVILELQDNETFINHFCNYAYDENKILNTGVYYEHTHRRSNGKSMES